MSADKFNAASASREVVESTDWSNTAGSATWSAGTKSLAGGVTVFKEMFEMLRSQTGPAIVLRERQSGIAGGVDASSRVRDHGNLGIERERRHGERFA